MDISDADAVENQLFGVNGIEGGEEWRLRYFEFHLAQCLENRWWTQKNSQGMVVGSYIAGIVGVRRSPKALSTPVARSCWQNLPMPFLPQVRQPRCLE
jgi:hypothetical protein